MPKGRVTNLPPVTAKDVTQHPDKLRRTPSGGYAWTCHYCRQYASSETQAGLYVCYQHGGASARQRDPVLNRKARAKGRKPPRPPGRPIEHGFYSRGERLDVRELERQYQELGLKLDDTDSDIVQLRARVQNLIADEPGINATREALAELLDAIDAWLQTSLADEPITVNRALEIAGILNAVDAAVRRASKLYNKLVFYDERIKRDHERIIHLVHKRADTKVKMAAAEQLDFFTMLVKRLYIVLSEMMTPEQFLALQKRIMKDYEDLPKNALEPGRIKN
jgi:hypothetical protein